jgi:hypothetical protein
MGRHGKEKEGASQPFFGYRAAREMLGVDPERFSCAALPSWLESFDFCS